MAVGMPRSLTRRRRPRHTPFASHPAQRRGRRSGVAMTASRSTFGRITIGNVAIGPSNNENSHHSRPLRPFDWASPAFTRDSVPQPATAPAPWGAVTSAQVIISMHLLSARLYLALSVHGFTKPRAV